MTRLCADIYNKITMRI